MYSDHLLHIDVLVETQLMVEYLVIISKFIFLSVLFSWCFQVCEVIIQYKEVFSMLTWVQFWWFATIRLNYDVILHWSDCDLISSLFACNACDMCIVLWFYIVSSICCLLQIIWIRCISFNRNNSVRTFKEEEWRTLRSER